MNGSTPRERADRAAPSAADLVYAHARHAIMTRKYAPNDLITEGELAAVTGVSRTPVREALLRLQGEGMVRLLPKRGALVLAITAEEAIDIMELRRMFELHAVRVAMGRTRGALAARLADEMGRMRAAIADGDLSGYLAADRAFHVAIIAAAGNEIMAEFYDGLRDRQLRMSSSLYDAGGVPDFSRPTEMLPDHQAILDAVATGTNEDAKAAIDAHLDHARQTFRYA